MGKSSWRARRLGTGWSDVSIKFRSTSCNATQYQVLFDGIPTRSRCSLRGPSIFGLALRCTRLRSARMQLGSLTGNRTRITGMKILRPNR